MPAIIDPSPYYTSLGRGNETQYIHTTAGRRASTSSRSSTTTSSSRAATPSSLADAIGTAFSTGCPLHGGPGDVAGFKAVIDWLEGRTPGYTTLDGTTPVTADWDNGKNAMIGKSYDGTFANGVASTGVDGLTTIVPISAISDWYDYSRMGGIRVQHALSGEPLQHDHAERQRPRSSASRRRVSNALCARLAHRDERVGRSATATPTATSTRSGRTATTT